SKIKADYASVNEQSGIFAGEDGYQINVKGNTDLKGALITSLQSAEDSNKNSLSTGSLTFSDIQNHADYEGESFGISGSGGFNTDMGLGGRAANQSSATNEVTDANGTTTTVRAEGKESVQASGSIGFGSDSGHESSTTYSGINTANITITNEAKQQELTGKSAAEIIAEIKTDISTEDYAQHAGYLKNNFDKDKVQAELDLQREVTQEFSQNVQTAQTELNKSKDEINKELKDPDLTAERRAELEQKHDNLDNLGLLLSVVSSGLSAPTDSLGGILAASASPVVAHEIGQFFKEQAAQNDDGKLTKGQEAAHIAAHAILGAAVAAAGGNDAVTSALAAGGAELATPVVSQWLYGTSDPEKLTAEQKKTLSSISGLIGAGAGAFSGDVSSIVAGSQVAQNAVDNNLLSQKEYQRRSELLQKGQGSGLLDWGSLTEAEAREYIFLVNKDRYSDELLARYKTDPNNLTELEKRTLAILISQAAEGDPNWARSILASPINHSLSLPNIDQVYNKALHTIDYYNSTDYKLAKAAEPALYFLTGGAGAFVRVTSAFTGGLNIGLGAQNIIDGNQTNGVVQVVNGMLQVGAAVTSVGTTVKKTDVTNSLKTAVDVGKATSGAENAANIPKLNAELVGKEISGGHSFEKHIVQQGEFTDLGIVTREQFAAHIENVVKNPTSIKELSSGRSAYWDKLTGTVVIRNPKAIDGGTAFRPTNGREYFDNLR
uniref:VENN motif pre-toxin domain-containing protein n=1 Tax=Stenoxybacter acetivorans TaxID=422441 RepID=UPI0014705F38